MANGRLQTDERLQDEPARETSPSTNEMFDALSAAQRRYVLHYLAGNGVVTLGELAEWVAERDAADAERTAIALHHGHLPKLTDVGLVEYDPSTRTVEPRPELSAAAPYLPLRTGR